MQLSTVSSEVSDPYVFNDCDQFCNHEVEDQAQVKAEGIFRNTNVVRLVLNSRNLACS